MQCVNTCFDCLCTNLSKMQLTNKFSEQKAFLVYTCGFFANSGNYKMGDTKIVPNLDAATFETIVRSSRAFAKSSAHIGQLWNKVKGPLFLLSATTVSLGLGDHGITTYFSDNCTKEDADLVNEWLKSVKLEAYNLRTFKTVSASGQVEYDIKLASVLTSPVTEYPSEVYRGASFKVTRGDYSSLLSLVNVHLDEAKKEAANSHQSDMLTAYISSFQTGSLDDHKKGSR